MENQIALLNEDGTVKSKEEFLKSIESVYEEMVAAYEEEELKNMSSLELVSDPEAIIDVEATLESFDFRQRSIFLTEEITQDHANSVFEVIRFWNEIDRMDEIPKDEREPIRIYINTPGGDLDATFSIISSIKLSETPVHTVTIGTGYSGGFFIGISGHKRYGYPYSSYLFHEGSSMDGGDAHKFIQRTDFYKKQLARLKKLVIDNTKISSEQYDEYRKDDWFMEPEDALKYGVIDEIVKEGEII